MQALIRRDWSNDERWIIAAWLRRIKHKTGVPTLARRDDLHDFVEQAIAHELTMIRDDISEDTAEKIEQGRARPQEQQHG